MMTKTKKKKKKKKKRARTWTDPWGMIALHLLRTRVGATAVSKDSNPFGKHGLRTCMYLMDLHCTYLSTSACKKGMNRKRAIAKKNLREKGKKGDEISSQTKKKSVSGNRGEVRHEKNLLLAEPGVFFLS